MLFDEDVIRKKAALALGAPVVERAAGASSGAPVPGERREEGVQPSSGEGTPSDPARVGRLSVPVHLGASSTGPYQPRGASMHVEVPFRGVMVEPRKLRLEDHRDNGRAVFATLCKARTCPSCGKRHIALKVTPAEALCLACALAEERRKERERAERAPTLPGL